MILVPQEAAIMNGRPYDKILNSLTQAILTNQVLTLDGSNGSVVGIVDEQFVLPFTIPVRVKLATGGERYCVDLRKMNREFDISEDGRRFTPKLLTETSFNVNHALAQKIWIQQPSLFGSIYYHAARIYANWIALKITKRLTLLPQQRDELIAYFAYYFITRSFRAGVMPPQEHDSIVYKLSTLFGFNANELNTILAPFKNKIPQNIDEFCSEIEKVTQSPKLMRFNRVMVQSMIIGGWIGPNGRELASLAVEYPPTFLTLLYRSLCERSFKDTDIAQMARTMNNTVQKQYMLLFADILSNATNTDY